MKFSFGIFTERLSFRLLLFNLFLWGALALIMAGLILAYTRVKPKLSLAISSGLERLTTNAHISRKIASTLTDAHLVLAGFEENPVMLEQESLRLLAALQTIREQSPQQSLRDALNAFSNNMNATFAQCTFIAMDILQVNGLANTFLVELDGLGETVAEKNKHAPSERTITVLKKYDEMIRDCRHEILSIERLRPLVKRNPVAGGLPEKTGIQPLLWNLEHRVAQFARSDQPDIAETGKSLHSLVQAYALSQQTLWHHLEALLQEFNQLTAARVRLMHVLDKIDSEAAQAGDVLISQVMTALYSSGLVILGMSCLLAVLAGIYASVFIRRHIRNPMQEIRNGIESVAAGSFPPAIRFKRDDEWEEIKQALFEMARKIQQSRACLEENNRNMEREITLRQAAEDELYISREAFRSIFEHMDDGIFRVQMDGLLLESNPAFRRIIQMEEPPQAGDSPKMETILPELDLQHLREELLKHNEIRSLDFPIQRRGQTRWVSMYARMEKDASGHPLQIYGLAQDVTERKEQLEALRKAKEAAEESARAKGQFLANMSHEIRTPLGGVIGMTEMLSETQLDSQQQKYATAALQSAHSLMGIINDILDFSKIEANRMQIEHIDFSLQNVLDSRLKSPELQARQKKLQFEISIGENVPGMFRGDPNRLGQILVNLVGNAIKFTDSGHIWVKISRVPESRQRGVSLYTFTVDDTGIGIRTDKLLSIFDSFSQEDGSLTRRFGGTGLGLAISKQLTELMGGNISARNRQGGGSSFQIILPLTDVVPLSNPAQKRKTETRDISLLRGIRILLAEDNAVNRLFVSDLLEQAGIAVQEAENGKQALALLKKKHFDLVLMDIQMPIMDGISTTQKIRVSSEEHLRNIPIIALTAHAMAHEKQRFLQCGMNDHIAKPVDQEELFEILLKYLPEKTFPSASKSETYALCPPPGILDTCTALDNVRQDRELLETMRTRFIGQALHWRDALAEMADAPDHKKLQEIIHSMIGSAGPVGAAHLKETATDLRLKLKNGSTVEFSQTVDELDEALVRTLEEMDRERRHRV